MTKITKSAALLIEFVTIIGLLTQQVQALGNCVTETDKNGISTTVCSLENDATAAAVIQHTPVDAGVGGIHFMLLACLGLGLGMGVFKLSRLAKYLYWLD